MHIAWNEDESTLKTQIGYYRSDLDGNSTCSLVLGRDIPITTVMSSVDLQATVVLESIVYENYAINVTNSVDATELKLSASSLLTLGCFCGGTAPQSFTLN